MRPSEIGLMQPVVCKYRETTEWSSTVELMKLNFSTNGRMVYVRIVHFSTGTPGLSHQWYDVDDLDRRYVVVDTLKHH